jgi:phosphoserine phosphatase
MNVFDFDKTIFVADSTARFFFFELRRYPSILLDVPAIGFAAVRYYLFRIGNKTQFKERMYRFLKRCDTAKDVKDFWKKNLGGIKDFYHRIHRDDDVIVSASPEFLLKPLEELLHITVIASRVSPLDGTTEGLNCYHEEKVRRFREVYPDGRIEHFYSDSYSDEPLALLAEKAYIVDGETLIDWDCSHHKKNLRT